MILFSLDSTKEDEPKKEAFLALHSLSKEVLGLAAAIVDEVRSDGGEGDSLTDEPALTERLDLRPPIRMRGREVRQKRNVGFYANKDQIKGYGYSGILAPSKPLTPSMEALIRLVSKDFGMNPAKVGILINEYEEGFSIGPHSDDERDLVTGKTGVLAISMGASRTFRVKAKNPLRVFYLSDKSEESTPIKGRGVVWEGRTKAGTLLQMGGKDFQSLFTHEVPSLAKDKAIRWSLTFREYK